jgi:hypothetical protein
MDDGAQIKICGEIGEVPNDDDKDGPAMVTAGAEPTLLSE